MGILRTPRTGIGVRQKQIRKTLTGFAAVALLATAAPLHAQFQVAAGGQRYASAVRSQDPCGGPAADLSVHFDASGANGHGTVVHTEGKPATSGVLVGSCAAINRWAASALSTSAAPPGSEEAAAEGPSAESPVEPDAVVGPRRIRKPDRNRTIYYKNKLESSLQIGWLPNNIPFVFDRMIGIPDRMVPLHYTLVPFLVGMRWQMNGIGGRWIFRGNWDMSFAGTYTMIPRGPETRYFAYVMGIRRNFIQRNWPIVPFFEGTAGVGDINAKEPYGVLYAQGQDFTFTVGLHGGARWNISPRYAVSAGVAYMHISNLYMSEPRYPNYGINVYGPMVGFDVTLDRPRHRQVASR